MAPLLKPKLFHLILMLLMGALFSHCAQKASDRQELPLDHVEVMIEIPAGTHKKFEFNKASGKIEQDKTPAGDLRVIRYLGYPGNYGFIINTLLPKSRGGDGDPLDVIVLGAPIESGQLAISRVISILKLTDRGEKDDKIIAVAKGSPLYHVTDMRMLDQDYPGISEILKLWFLNYKGQGEMVFKGFGSKEEAQTIITTAREAFH